jgi:hypothetical protein
MPIRHGGRLAAVQRSASALVCYRLSVRGGVSRDPVVIRLQVNRRMHPDPVSWKKTDPAMRNRMKALQLAISYGMGVPSLARGLDRHPRHPRTHRSTTAAAMPALPKMDLQQAAA